MKKLLVLSSAIILCLSAFKSSDGDKIPSATVKKLDGSTINSNTFTLHQETTPVQGTVAAPLDAPASFTQSQDFKPDTVYTGKITTGAKDLAGNPLKSDFVWKFRKLFHFIGKQVG